MKFGIELLPATKIEKLVGTAVDAEQRGFEFCWVTDHYNNRNVYVSLGAIAAQTSKLLLGTGVTNPYTSNPCWTAAAIASIDEVSDGRAVFGIGAGDKATLAQLGIPWTKPLTAVKEAVQIIRTLLNNEKSKLKGQIFEISGAKFNFKTKRSIPIYIGAQGPKMLKTAAQYGEGVLINASSPKDFDVALPNIKEGCEAAGKSLSDVDVVGYTCFSVDDDAVAARKEASSVVAFIVAGSPPLVLERHGIAVSDADKIKDAIAKGDFGTAFGSVTEDMIEAFAVAGKADDCIDRIKELEKAGVTQFVVGSPIGVKKKRALEIFGESIKPKFG